MPTTLWPYVYKTLSKPEQATRRLALDAAGHSIIYTQLLLGTLLFVYLGLTRRWCRASPVARTLRRLEWRLKVPIAVTMPYWRCWGDWMIMAAWASYCLGVAMRNTGDDYLHLTKALGIVAAANFPLHFALAMKRSPLRWLFGLSYEGTANFLHGFLGRLIYLLLCGHAGLYLRFFYDSSLLLTRFLEFDILCGFFAFVALNVLAISSHPRVRAVTYRTFYLLHIGCASLILPLLLLHVPYLRVYVLPVAVLWGADKAVSRLRRVHTTASLRLLTPELIEITVDREALRGGRHRARPPGSHGLLRVPALDAWTWNPFTFTTPTIRSRVGYSSTPTKFVIRVHGHFTRKLAALASPGSEGGERPRKHDVALDLPFGSSLFWPPLEESFDRILLIAGGVGAAFTFSWATYLATVAKPHQIRFVWAVRAPQDALWATTTTDDDTAVAALVELCLTGAAHNPGEEDEDGGLQMQEAGLLSRGSTSASHEELDAVEKLVRAGIARERITAGRPDLGRVVTETVREARGPAAVLVCGPESMNMAVLKAAGKVAAEGRDVWCHVEGFSH